MTSIRVLKTNTANAVAALLAAGHTAQVASPHRSWNGGCGDPGCCAQHPRLDVMDGVITSASGKQAHKIFVAAGIVRG